MNGQDWLSIVQTIGVPTVVAGASFWFFRYMFDAAAKERHEFLNQDMENDNKIFELAELSAQAINNMSRALDANTKSLDLLTVTLRENKK